LVSSKSEKKADAIKLRERVLKQKMAGTLADARIGKTTCSELLNGLLRHADECLRPETARIYRWVAEAHLTPFFGHLKAVNVSSDLLREYRRQRGESGASIATCNRELSLLRIAFNVGRKTSPPLVDKVPWFPMEREDNARQGFLSDEQYAALRDALPDCLRPLFVSAYFTGVRLGELLAWSWEQVDWEQGFVTLLADETKSGHARAVPILAGDMHEWLKWAQEHSNGCAQVFNREGTPIKQFRAAWENACKAAEVPDLKFHDLRRTAVRNMRRAGVSQVVRMRITGHRTDSMERRYNIVDVEDIKSAKELMEGRVNGDVPNVSK
jgi:integrase